MQPPARAAWTTRFPSRSSSLLWWTIPFPCWRRSREPRSGPDARSPSPPTWPSLRPMPALGIPSSRLGVVIGFENVERLLLAVGPKRAAEILVTGRELSGEDAARWGLINEAVPAAALRDRAEELAERVASGAPLSVRASKRGLRGVLGKLSVDRETEGFRVTDFEMMAADAMASDELREGIRAFKERRKPEFRGS